MAKEAKSICFEPPAQVVVGWIRADSESSWGSQSNVTSASEGGEGPVAWRGNGVLCFKHVEYEYVRGNKSVKIRRVLGNYESG